MAVAFVNSTSGTFNAASGSPTAFSVTKGNLVVVVVSINGSATVSSVTDTVGTSYKRAKAQANGTTVNCEVWYGIVAATNASNSITVSLSASSKTAVCVGQYSGAGSIGASSGNTGSTSAPSVSVTTQLGNDSWVVGGTAAQGTGTFTAGSGTTQEVTVVTSGGSSASNVGGDEVDNHAAVNRGTAVTLNVTISAAATNSMVGVEIGNSPVRFFRFKRRPPTTGAPRSRLLKIRRTVPPLTRAPRLKVVRPKPRPPLGRRVSRFGRTPRPAQTAIPKAPGQLRVRTALRRGVTGKPKTRIIRLRRPPLVFAKQAPANLRIRTYLREPVLGRPHTRPLRVRRTPPVQPATRPQEPRVIKPRPRTPRAIQRGRTVRFGGRRMPVPSAVRPKRIHFIRPQRRAPLRPKKQTLKFGQKPQPAQSWIKGTRPIPQLGTRKSRMRPVTYPPRPRSKAVGRLRRPPQSWVRNTRPVKQLRVRAAQNRPLKGVPRKGSLVKIKGRLPVVAIAPIFRVKHHQAYPEGVHKVLPKTKVGLRKAKGQESVEVGSGKVTKGSAAGEAVKGTATLTIKKVKGTQQATKD